MTYAARTVNSYLNHRKLGLDTDERRILITSLVEVMIKRKDEADATDHSTLAWLLLNIKEEERARSVVRDGPELDPSNQHCLKLADKLNLTGSVSEADQHTTIAGGHKRPLGQPMRSRRCPVASSPSHPPLPRSQPGRSQ